MGDAQMDPIEACRRMAFALSHSDRQGRLLVRTLDLMQAVACGDDPETLKLDVQSLLRETTKTMNDDTNRDDPARSMLYGVSECLGLLIENLIGKSEQLEKEKENEEETAPANVASLGYELAHSASLSPQDTRGFKSPLVVPKKEEPMDEDAPIERSTPKQVASLGHALPQATSHQETREFESHLVVPIKEEPMDEDTTIERSTPKQQEIPLATSHQETREFESHLVVPIKEEPMDEDVIEPSDISPFETIVDAIAALTPPSKIDLDATLKLKDDESGRRKSGGQDTLRNDEVLPQQQSTATKPKEASQEPETGGTSRRAERMKERKKRLEADQNDRRQGGMGEKERSRSRRLTSIARKGDDKEDGANIKEVKDEIRTILNGLIDTVVEASDAASNQPHRKRLRSSIGCVKPPSPEKFTCTKCSRIFDQLTTLTKHMIVHDGFKCGDCGIMMKSDATLLKHYAEKHPGKVIRIEIDEGDWSPECEVCGALLRSRVAARVHARRHTGERPFPCELCPAAYTSLARLRQHLRDAHNEKPYQCDVCGEKFAKHNALLAHSQLTHRAN